LDHSTRSANVGIDFGGEDAEKIFRMAFQALLAGQLDTSRLGESRGAINTLDIPSVTALTPSIVGALPVGPAKLFARAGMIFCDVDANVRSLGTSQSLIDERRGRRSRSTRPQRL
jgi:hypothetical protein